MVWLVYHSLHEWRAKSTRDGVGEPSSESVRRVTNAGKASISNPNLAPPSTMVNAHGRKFWRAILPVVHRRKRRGFERLRGLRVGIDADYWMLDSSSHLRTLSRAALGTCQGYYEPTELVQAFFRRHEKLLNFDIKPTYVFSGRLIHPMIKPPAQYIRNAERELEELIAWRRLLRDEQPGAPSSRYPRKFATLLRTTRQVDPKLGVFVAQALAEQGIRVFCAPFLARYQLVAWELDHRIDATWTERDGHYLALGSRRLILGGTFSKNESYMYHRHKDMKPGVCIHNVLAERKDDYLGVATAMFGCDYIDQVRMLRLRTNVIFQQKLVDYIEANESQDEGKLDQLMRGDWQMTPFQIDRFQKAVNMFRHCPVLRPQQSATSGTPEWRLVPLHSYSSDKQWKDMIGFDPADELPVAPEHYEAASRFQSPTPFHFREPKEDEPSNWYDSVTPAFEDTVPGGSVVKGKVTNKLRPGRTLMREYVARVSGKSLEEINERADWKKRAVKDDRTERVVKEKKEKDRIVRAPDGVGKVVYGSSSRDL